MNALNRTIMLLCTFMLEITLTTPKSINVMDFGAVGDKENDDTPAFVMAWNEVCHDEDLNPMMIVPADKTFLVHSIDFKGPCSSSTVIFQVLGQIVAPQRHQFITGKRWITFKKINGLIINGNGSLDGSADNHNWWNLGNSAKDRPPVLRISECALVILSGLTFLRPPRSHISITSSRLVMIENIRISAPEHSPNTDGIDISHSSVVYIHNSNIQTGDDCIAINSGCSYINITNINCGPGHGISIGSLGKSSRVIDTVEHVYVQNCTFVGTMNAARIKTWNVGAGFARHITYENIKLVNSRNPIIIDQEYCPHKHCDYKPAKIKISDVSFVGFRGTSDTKAAINFNCSSKIACEDIKIDNISIHPSAKLKGPTISSCNNAYGSSTNSCIPKVTCLSNESLV